MQSSLCLKVTDFFLKKALIIREIIFIATKVESPLGWTWSNGWLGLLIYLSRAALEKQIQHIYT